MEKVQAQKGLTHTGGFALLAKQRGLAYLTKSQGANGAFVDTCFNGEAMCGSARLPGLQSTVELKDQPKAGSRTIRFGGGAATSNRRVCGQVQVGGVTEELSVDVVPGHLPLLLGTGANKRYGLDVMACGKIKQAGVTLSEWNVDDLEMPWVVVRRPEGRSTSLLTALEPVGQTSRCRSHEHGATHAASVVECKREDEKSTVKTSENKEVVTKSTEDEFEENSEVKTMVDEGPWIELIARQGRSWTCDYYEGSTGPPYRRTTLLITRARKTLNHIAPKVELIGKPRG